MFRKPTIASSLALGLALALPTSQVQAVMANLVRQYAASTPGGQSYVVCVYALDGKEFERQYPAGNFCPARAEP